MQPGRWTRGIALVGAACVIASTFLHWGLADVFISYLGSGRAIYRYLPPADRAQTAWSAFPVVAALLIVAALLGAAVHLIPLGNERQRQILGVGEAAFVLVFALAFWISPPRSAAGPGQPLATVGALFLLWATALTHKGPLRGWRGPWKRSR